MRYAAGFSYDAEDYEDGDEWIVERNQFDWLIEGLEEHMPKRRNSQVIWASAIDDNDRILPDYELKVGHEIDITQKVLQTLKTRKDT